MDVDATINLSKCIITRNHFGYDDYLNICTGKLTATVPWTYMEWTGTWLLIGCTIGILCFFVWLVLSE